MPTPINAARAAARPPAVRARATSTPAGTPRPATPASTVLAAAPAPDRLETSAPAAAPPSRPLTPREQIAVAEKLMGKPAKFKTDAERDAYLQSIEASKPQASYDPQGFLKGLGLTGVRASGRTDAPVLTAVRAMAGYRPDTQLGHKDIWIQQRVFDLAVKKPETFLALAKRANPVIEAKGKLQKGWEKLKPAEAARPSAEKAADRYEDALATIATMRFGDDFHGGIPGIHGPAHPTYGTYQIARAMGFDDAAARRFGASSVGVDENATPYGKTSPSPLDRIDRHFNLDRDGEDTRLVYAKKHLDQAVAYAKVGAFDQAEVEVGMGLHSLQDLFAHGQLSPALHGTLGQFPDDVDWNPVGFYEATAATGAYLKAYLTAVSKP